MPLFNGAGTVTTVTPTERARRMALFLDAFRNSCNVRAGCDAAKISTKTAYQWRKKYQRFADAWALAEKDAVDVLRAEAWRRAREAGAFRLH